MLYGACGRNFGMILGLCRRKLLNGKASLVQSHATQYSSYATICTLLTFAPGTRKPISPTFMGHSMRLLTRANPSNSLCLGAYPTPAPDLFLKDIVLSTPFARHYFPTKYHLSQIFLSIVFHNDGSKDVYDFRLT